MNPEQTWIVVPIKDVATAKTRLATVMNAAEREACARDTATRVLRAALEVAPTLAVCGGEASAALGAGFGAEVIIESAPAGQNAAAGRGIGTLLGRGVPAVLLLSADLPLVDAAAVRAMLARAETTTQPVVIAAPAVGRGGTNALLLRPLDDFVLHFGDDSLTRFAEEARRRGRTFITHDDVRLALDLDEPGDLATLRDITAATAAGDGA